ncbi:ran-binding protein 3 [Culicoides brevitarsis]|uniref:ran-binding protein 3 n=1 Tax=Culicoides brevitarsis TaxID=469753 RepID=UPI00307C8D76
MLRPSQFQLNSGNTADAEKTFKLKPSQLTVTSPLAGGGTAGASSASDNANSTSNNTPKESDGESSNSNSGPLFANPFMRAFSRDEDSPAKPDPKEKDAKKDENLDPLAKLGSNSAAAALPKSNLFNVKAATLSSGAGFVFGQNIGERVTGQSTNLFGAAATTTKSEAENASEDTKKDETEKEKSCNGAGTSSGGLFFSNVAAAAATNSNSDAIETKESDGKSLLEATRQYEEKVKVQKRKYEEVETITGEEDERNIVEINGKVFAFEDRNYEERGRGTLRLNDSKVKQNESRVVFRTSGNLRVLINTKVWSKMIVEKPSTKSLRMTAIDSEGHIKVFLMQARPDDISQLYKYLTERVNKLKALDEEMERKSKELVDAENDAETTSPPESKPHRSTTPTQYPANPICIKINDQEAGESECKKVRVDDADATGEN